MAQKRPFDDEVVNEVSSKHPRQDEPSEEMKLCNTLSEGASSEKSHDLDDAAIAKGDIEYREELENGNCPESSQGGFDDNYVPRTASLSHWATRSPSESLSDEDEPSEEAFHLPFFPSYFGFEHAVRTVMSPEDAYHYRLDHPPRRRVPIGPDYQADIPVLSAQGYDNNEAECGASTEIKNADGEIDGICIIQTPENEPPPYKCEKVGSGRVDCRCLDQGSIRCVRQHVAEARYQLVTTVGQDTFTELGFYDMGEVVAEKWSEKEEHSFHEVVYSNPVSLGKNFWNVLSAVFPTRTKMEIVSYYFNVFMLRKRAEQNRCDPTNIDSDNDEWQVSDDDGINEGGYSEDDEDSGVESPLYQNGLEFHQNNLHGHEHEQEEDGGDFSDDAQEPDDKSGNSDGFTRKSNPKSSFEFQGKKSDDDRGDNDVQDGSCTSSDSGAPVQGSQIKSDGCQEWNHEYIFSSAETKAWDGFNLSCPKNKVDFLPTCSMIEEVFGDCDFDSKSKNW